MVLRREREEQRGSVEALLPATRMEVEQKPISPKAANQRKNDGPDVATGAGASRDHQTDPHASDDEYDLDPYRDRRCVGERRAWLARVSGNKDKTPRTRRRAKGTR